MAQITKRKSGSYRIGVYLGRYPDGKKIMAWTTFVPDPLRTRRQNEKTLQSFAVAFEQNLKENSRISGRITFRAFAESWMQTYGKTELEATTSTGYESLLKNILYPKIGNVRLTDIRVPTVCGLLEDLRHTEYEYRGRKGTYSGETVRSAKVVLSSVLSAAMEDGLISYNPCIVRTRRHKKVEKPGEVKTFSAAEAARFLAVLDMEMALEKGGAGGKRKYRYRLGLRYQTLFLTAVYTGCRRGELIALTWEDIDFAAKTIRICKSAAYTPRTGQYVKTPKSAAGFREIMVPDTVLTSLWQLKNIHKRVYEQIPRGWKGAAVLEKNHVFCSGTGRMMTISAPLKELTRFLDAYNSTFPEKPLPVITFHQLRHTSASLLIASGMEPVAVARRLGHANAATTLRIYAHSFAERDTTACRALEKMLGRSGQQA